METASLAKGVNIMKGASSKGSAVHRQGQGEVQHFVKHMIVKDITTWDKTPFAKKTISLNIVWKQIIVFCLYLSFSQPPDFEQ